MGAVAYYLTLVEGVLLLALSLYGLLNDLKNHSFPQKPDEVIFTIGIAVTGWAMSVTAIQALWG